MDPLTWDYPDLTPYQYSGNDPIANIDLDGLEPKNVVKKLLGSLSDQGINASSKLLEKGANAGKWLVSWIDKGGVAQLKMFASKSASALSTALNIGAKVADVGLDFVPIAGGARDIYRGVRDGNWVQAGIGALSIVADIFTFGGSSVAKGIIKNAVKEGIEATTKKGVKEVSETAGRQLLLTAGKIHKHHVLPQKFRKWFKERGVSNIDDFTVEISQNTHLKGVHGKGLNPQLPGNWNKQWQDFIEANPKATPSEIFHQAEGLLKRFGLEHLPYKLYKN